MKYVALLRGINVGGKNLIPMAELRRCLEEHGFVNVRTYIQSGNVILESKLSNRQLGQEIEAILVETFKLDSSLIRVLVLDTDQLQSVINNRPKGFGNQPDIYHYDVIFLMGIGTNEAIQVFNPREGVDQVWAGDGVIYSERLSAERTKSRLNRIMGTPAYQSMTIRNWNTTTKLLELLQTS